MPAPPTRPTPSRSSSRYSSYHDAIAEDAEPQQAGRSSTNLAAQNSARSLREQSRPNLLKKKSRSQTPQQQQQREQQATPLPAAIEVAAEDADEDAAPHVEPVAASAPTRPQIAPHARTISRARTATPSTSTLMSDDDRRSSSSFPFPNHTGPASTTATAAGAALAAEMQLTPFGTGAQTPSSRIPLLQDLSYNNSSLSLTRQTTPRSVRDLGSDYTRYFNPFATNNNSRSDLSSLLRYNDSTTHLAPALASADLHQRLSNPFHETKRYFNPFESRSSTAPGTPRPLQTGQDEFPGATPMVAPVRSASAAHSVSAMALPRGPPSERPGTPNFIRDADPEKAAFFPYLDDRLGAPEYAFPLFTDQKEDDDDMHMPQWDDDVKLKPKFKDHFTRENIVSTFGLVFMMLGLLLVFVVLPVVSYTGTSLIDYQYETPLDQLPDPDGAQSWATVNDVKYPLFSNMRSSLIDDDTPKSAMSRKGVHGDHYKLVFSDEFNAPNRTFYPGDDPYWYGFDGWYGATRDLEYYDPDAANTGRFCTSEMMQEECRMLTQYDRGRHPPVAA
nr:beta-glucan synthesis-associated protein kre6 [Quercus suber]